MGDEWEQAKIAFGYYFKSERTHAWDPASRKWIPRDQAPDAGGSPPGLSDRAEARIAKIQDAEGKGLLSHDAAETEILQIIREES